ncbi:hypothetical protein J2X20_003521 [Pelomonas saccharophila]|uniref:Uncharacterized protein n=1 Tax=Roseateles saccharophilus TaxID=304 RepID=A0ABU1YPS5_ROSSA|nr:hypothetical protein [Roseateles saccharophilus]MDR7270863.1 hypothetical protein [Roseateles saccharophilus]
MPIATDPLAQDSASYARCIEVSKRIRWDIDRDVIRGRHFDLASKFLPDGLSLAHELPFLTPAQRLFYGQVQGRTYANMFGMIERYIGVKMLEVGRSHGFGDQTAFEALVRLTDEELKHQELFRRIERLAAEAMPPGYRFALDGNDVAAFVLGKCSWAVLALTCHIELFSQAHYRASIEGAAGLSDLFKDVFLFHWKEESQHAILDELEWVREDATLTPAARDAAVGELIELVGGVDSLLQVQARADAAYFRDVTGIGADHREAVESNTLRAYRWQYIVSGVLEPRFQKALGALTNDAQMARMQAALGPLIAYVGDCGEPALH